ncbi:MAG: DUF3501 family protein [Myxococcota bacterium]
MRRVRRDEIVDFVTYGETRAAERTRVLALKEPRRIHVGAHLTFLFENADTVRYQIQEMMRAEQMVKEADIRHELDTYNELLGGTGELGCTLLIEIETAKERDEKLRAWRTLPQHLYARLADGTRVRPTFDARQLDDERLSSVQYLKLDTHGQVTIALGADHPALTVEALLTAAQREALDADLRSDA